jgi:hypothetical protein
MKRLNENLWCLSKANARSVFLCTNPVRSAFEVGHKALIIRTCMLDLLPYREFVFIYNQLSSPKVK